MREAAHHMVRNLTAGMAMITCRDHILLSIKNNLKNLLMTIARTPTVTTAPSEQITMAVEMISNVSHQSSAASTTAIDVI